jgi:hypothetical protein
MIVQAFVAALRGGTTKAELPRCHAPKFGRGQAYDLRKFKGRFYFVFFCFSLGISVSGAAASSVFSGSIPK